MHHPPLPPGPGLGLPVAVGALLRPPEPLRPRPNRHIGRCVEPLAGERRPPSRPGNRRSGPDAGNPEMLEFALSQETARTAPLLPPVEGREENLLFRFVSVPPLVQGPAVPTFSKKEQIPFPPGSQVHGTTVCDACLLTLAHDPCLPVAKRVRFGEDIPPPRTSGQSRSGPREFGRGCPSNAHAFLCHPPYSLRCTSTGTSIEPLERCTASGGVAHAAQPVSLAHAHNSTSATRFSSPRRPPSSTAFSRRRWQSERPCLCCRGDCCPPAKDAIEPVPPAEMRQGFYSPYFIVHKKGGLPSANPGSASLEPGFAQASRSRSDAQAHDQTAFSPRDWFAAIDLKDAYFHVRSFRDTDRFYGLRSKVGHGITGSSPSGSPCLPVCSRRL